MPRPWLFGRSRFSDELAAQAPDRQLLGRQFLPLHLGADAAAAAVRQDFERLLKWIARSGAKRCRSVMTISAYAYEELLGLTAPDLKTLAYDKII